MNYAIEKMARAIYYASDMQRLVGDDPYSDDPHGRMFAIAMAQAAFVALGDVEFIFREGGEAIHEIRGDPPSVFRAILKAIWDDE